MMGFLDTKHKKNQKTEINPSTRERHKQMSRSDIVILYVMLSDLRTIEPTNNYAHYAVSTLCCCCY